MDMTAADIISQLMQEVPESKIESSPEDPVAFAESLEKAASSLNDPVDEKMDVAQLEKLAKLSIIEELSGEDFSSKQRFCEIFSNTDALLPDVTEEEKVAATWVNDDARPTVRDYLYDPDAEFMKKAFLENTGILGRYICRRFGIT